MGLSLPWPRVQSLVGELCKTRCAAKKKTVDHDAVLIPEELPENGPQQQCCRAQVRVPGAEAKQIEIPESGAEEGLPIERVATEKMETYVCLRSALLADLGARLLGIKGRGLGVRDQLTLSPLTGAW